MTRAPISAWFVTHRSWLDYDYYADTVLLSVISVASSVPSGRSLECSHSGMGLLTLFAWISLIRGAACNPTSQAVYRVVNLVFTQPCPSDPSPSSQIALNSTSQHNLNFWKNISDTSHSTIAPNDLAREIVVSPYSSYIFSSAREYRIHSHLLCWNPRCQELPERHNNRLISAWFCVEWTIFSVMYRRWNRNRSDNADESICDNGWATVQHLHSTEKVSAHYLIADDLPLCWPTFQQNLIL